MTYKLSLRAKVMQLIGLQAGVVIALSLLITFFLNGWLGGSFLLGGMLSIVPGAVFSYHLFKETHARAAGRIMRRFLWGEILKLIFIGILFVIIIKFIAINLLSFVIGFFIAQMGVWLAPAVFLTKSGVTY